MHYLTKNGKKMLKEDRRKISRNNTKFILNNLKAGKIDIDNLTFIPSKGCGNPWNYD